MRCRQSLQRAVFRKDLRSCRQCTYRYKHNNTGEDNAAAHLRSLTMGHEVIVPVTKGALDLGPWQRVFYGEWDGQRKKRVIVKIMGE
jgi:secondary thiamine-phosphate synthase enzyme